MSSGRLRAWLRAFALLAIVLPMMSSAQDLIIKTNGDTIACKIRGMDKKGIHYRYQTGQLVEDAYIGLHEVKEVRQGATTQRIAAQPRGAKARGYPTLRLAASASAGWLSDGPEENDPQWVQDYDRELQSGWSYAIDLHFMVSREWAVGLAGSWFRTSHAVNDVALLLPDGTYVVGQLADDVRISLIGPSVLFSPGLPDMNLHPCFTATIGVADFRDEAIVIVPITATGTSLGASLGFSLEYRFNNGIGLFAGGRGVWARMANVTFESGGAQGQSTQTLDVSRWDLGGGISFTR